MALLSISHNGFTQISLSSPLSFSSPSGSRRGWVQVVGMGERAVWLGRTDEGLDSHVLAASQDTPCWRPHSPGQCLPLMQAKTANSGSPRALTIVSGKQKKQG